MKEKYKYQLAVIFAVLVLVVFLTFRNWDNISTCQLGYKLWPTITMAYFWLIRLIEL